MNPKFLDDKYLLRFIKERKNKILSAICVCQWNANNYPDFNLQELDLNTVLRIRDEHTGFIFSEAIINSVQKNPKGSMHELIIDVIAYVFEYRAHLAGACFDCKENVYDAGEYSYILKKAVWRKASKKQHDHFLCVGCVENRLKRKLSPADFNWDIPLNTLPYEYRSDRLEQRMGMEN